MPEMHGNVDRTVTVTLQYPLHSGRSKSVILWTVLMLSVPHYSLTALHLIGKYNQLTAEPCKMRNCGMQR